MSNLVKSRQRVIDHGEVFTPSWMVEAMLDLVKDESERIDSRFLEPACGAGNFLIATLLRKLATVRVRYGGSSFEQQHYGLLALMSIYGIELLADNVAECQQRLVETFLLGLGVADDKSTIASAAHAIVRANIIHGDALSMTTNIGNAIVFPEWAYLGKGRFQRRDFRYDSLTTMSSFSREDSLFSTIGEHEIFQPIKDYPPQAILEIGNG